MSKRIFITGGASGLGKAIAVAFARKGWRVCIGDVNQAQGEETAAELARLFAANVDAAEEKPNGETALFSMCDVRSEADIEAVRDRLVDTWGGVDVIVNNAGVAGNSSPIEFVPIEDWEWVIDINVLGIARVYRAFVPLLRQQGSGHFVNIASAAGLMNAPSMVNYNASKAAVIAISDTTRLELSPHNIGVTAVCPGFFPTNIADSIRGVGVEKTSSFREKINSAMEKSGVKADDVASEIYRAVKGKKYLVLPHKLERRLWLLKRLWPEAFFKIMLEKTTKQKIKK